ncbi:hypothetical protein M405DRAFT_830419 [Rhizopogon salebrosus TDB-379]|nr:hypothetical protein M405DRAFT_830419 [Rhizopogon salebrosus TDB-379]
MATHSTTGSSRQISLIYQGHLEMCANQLQKSYQSLTSLTRSLMSNGGPTTKA